MSRALTTILSINLTLFAASSAAVGLQRQTGAHTCGLPIGARGTEIKFKSSGPAYDAALSGVADKLPEIEKTAQMSYEQATRFEGAFLKAGQHDTLLLFRGANGYFCGASHCFIDLYRASNGSWKEIGLGEIADKAYLYHTKNRFPALSSAPILDEESYVMEFDPKSGAYEPCEAETRIALKEQGGTFVVPVLINNAITLDFTVDSGASDVAVPADVFLTLTRTGTVDQSDITGRHTYVTADGSTMTSTTFWIRSLKVGRIILRNVNAVVAPANGSLLLGQSFLRQFKSWSFDNGKHELVLK